MTTAKVDLGDGYSKRPLVEKLGIKARQRIAILQAPPDYAATLGPLPDQVVWSDELGEALVFIHFFATSRQELVAQFPHLKAALAHNGMLWISWPKRTVKNATVKNDAVKVSTDLNENSVREIGLSNDLVDVKVAAIDPIWSGLKFVYRLQDR